MRHLMICFSGWAGTGKDECAGRLIDVYKAIQSGLADPGKRHLADAYGFSELQLWGPSKYRNAGDPRYPKPLTQRLGLKPIEGTDHWGAKVTSENKHLLGVKEEDLPYFAQDSEYPIRVENTDPRYFLSPREALQIYLEMMNNLYADTWIDKGIETHIKLADIDYKVVPDFLFARKNWSYSKAGGLQKMEGSWTPSSGVSISCFSDFRHINEHSVARANQTDDFVPVLVRVKRPTVTKPPFNHRSETEQTRIRDEAYDFIIQNNGSLNDLYLTVDNIVQICSKPEWKGKTWKNEYVLEHERDSYAP